MNTPSHIIINTALARLLPITKKRELPISAVIWGSFAPDVMLYLMTIFVSLYFIIFQGWALSEALGYCFDVLFFENSTWIFLHNILQAPFILLAGIGGSLLVLTRERGLTKKQRAIAQWILIFFISCSIHVVLDILTHHDDGPLLLFPFNSTIKFYSPVSYWDPNRYGNIFVVFEIILNIVGLTYLIVRRIRIRKIASASQ